MEDDRKISGKQSKTWTTGARSISFFYTYNLSKVALLEGKKTKGYDSKERTIQYNIPTGKTDIYIYTCMHPSIHTCIQTYLRTYIHICIQRDKTGVLYIILDRHINR